MKALAFSLAVTLLVVGRCQGGAIPGQTGSQDNTGGQSGLQEVPPGPCGKEAVVFPLPQCDCQAYPLTCGSDGSTCCLAYETLRASGQCEKGMAMPMEPGTDCEDKDKCEGTCGNQLVVAGTIIQICCMDMDLPKPPEPDRDRMCPEFHHPDRNINCKDQQCGTGICATETKGDTTTETEMCCVEGVYRCDNEKTCSTDEDCAASTVAGGNCIQPYGKDTHHCCILAIPIIQPPADMPKCEDVNQFLGAVVLMPTCSAIFQELLTVQKEKDYCTVLVRGIECFAGEAFPNNGLESNVCLNKLKHLIRKDLKQILVAVKALVGLMSENPVDLSAIENYDPGKICPAIGEGSTTDSGKYTCTVDYDNDGQVDMTFHAGETYPDSEACNACTCSGNNLAACTEMACIPSQGTKKQCKTQTVKMEKTPTGSVRPQEDQAALPEYVDSGTWHPAGDDCNHCYCFDGRYKCTTRRCSPRLKPDMSRCPAMTFVTSDTICDSTNKCDKDNLCDPGYHCCRTACGGGTECKPDLGVCADADKMIEFSTLKQAEECGKYFVTVATQQQTGEQFCQSFFDGIQCFAEKLGGEANDEQEGEMIKMDCERRMMAHLMQNGAEALRKILEHLRTLDTPVGQVDHDPARCDVVTRHLAEKAEEYDQGQGRPSQPAFDRGTAAKCGDITQVFNSVQECMPNLNQGQGQGQGNTGIKAECDSLKRLLHCVIVKLGEGGDETRCLGAIKQLLVEHKERVVASFPALTHLQKCHDMDHVCGEGKMPHPVKHCGETDREGCPGGYECRKDFCCPKEREGQCPDMRGPPNCANQHCEVDDDCDGEDEKCCGDQRVCESKVCVSLVSTNKSQCHKEFDKAVEKLGQMGVCGGDGKTLIEVPRCQGENFAPVQGDFRRNQLYCANEDGTKKGAEFEGVKNCVKEREGKCPAKPAVCEGKDVDTLNGSCRDDDDCQTKEQRCCPTQLDNGSCGKMCKTSQAVSDTDVTPIQACPNNEERSCCPVTFNVDKRCPAHPGAIPTINPCGGCKTEWFDKDGNKVDCHENLSKCRREQAVAMEKNMRMRSEAERLALFIKDLRQYHRAPEEKEKDEYDEEAHDMDDLEKDEGDYGEWTDEETTRYMSWITEKVCYLMDSQKVCQNGGSCALKMANRRPHQLCSCPAGFGGLFCEKASKPAPCKTVNCLVDPCMIPKCSKHPSATCHSNYCGGCNAQFLLNAGTKDEIDVTFDCSDCQTNKMIADTTLELLRGYGPKAMMMHKLLTLMPPKHYSIPMWECDADGKYNQMQKMLMIPVMKEATIFKVCVDTANGMRVDNTPIVFESSGQDLDCTVRQDIDSASRNPRCWLKKYADCKGTLSQCQYYFNADTGACEQGEAGWGFRTATECYDKCRPKEEQCPSVPAGTMGHCAEMCPETGCGAGKKCCSNGCGHVCKDVANTTPVPCKDLQCNYTTEYCDVTMDLDSGEHVGTCKKFQEHCLMPKDPGFGKAKFGAYYFDSRMRMCRRFTYHGMGGNKNRFSMLHQCQTECAKRYYEYSGAVCPHPKLLTPKDMLSVDMCDDDSMCHHGDMKGVCCSDGKHRVCTMPVKNCQGHRCSFYGECDANEMCYCPKCDDSAGTQQVCGSDDKTYDNECKLRMFACTERKKIYKKSDGACPANPVMPMGEECANMWPCTMDYKPLCLLDKTDPTKLDTKTVNNPCEMAKYKKCYNAVVEVLYKGACVDERPCSHCSLYHTACVNSQCGCEQDCTQDYTPVCGHPHDRPDQAKLFSNLCEMRQQGCENNTIYVVTHAPEACSKVEKTEDDLLECPKFDGETMGMMAMPGMDAVNCDLKDDNFCVRGKERCCQIGEGTHCIPKEKLERKRFEPRGMPPILSVVNFDMKNCLARRCKDFGDFCKGDGICAENFVCGHNTCAPPIIKPSSPHVCPADHFMLPKMLCNGMDPENSGCPLNSECTAVTRGQHTLHVCCAATKDKDLYSKEVIYKAKLSHYLMHMGLMCMNDGVFDPSLEDSQVCNCAGTGHTGAFCTDSPGTLDTKCTRQRSLMGKLAEKMRDLIAMVMEKDDDDSKEKDSDSEGMGDRGQGVGQGTGQGMGGDRDGMGQGNEGGNMKADEDDDDKEMKERDGMGGDMDDMHEFIERMLQEEMPGVGLAKLLVMEKGLKYLLLDVECDAQGNFMDAQCGITLEKPHRHGCFCVDKTKWSNHLPGPMAETRDKVDCNMIKSDIPEFCYNRPMMGGKDSMPGRYYFNPDTADCQRFKEGQWCDPNGNNFPTYETCRSTCSSTSWTASPCWSARCPSGTACRGMMGRNAECKNVTRPNEIPNHFEPKCSKDGKFNPKQCTCTTCFCVNPETGEPIEGAIGAGEELGCQLDPTSPNGHGVRVTKPQAGQGFECERQNGAEVEPKVCKAPGHPCHNCMKTMEEGDRPGQGQGMGQGQGQGQNQGQGQGQNMRPDNMYGGLRDQQTNENGVCRNCGTCPPGQGMKRCPTKCPEDKECTQFASAQCVVNRCTCELEWKTASGMTIKCDEPQPQCLKVKDAVIKKGIYKQLQNAEKRAEGEMVEEEMPDIVLHCTPGGSFESNCTTKSNGKKSCFCLNPNDGKPDHATPVEIAETEEKPNCADAQKKQYKMITHSMKIHPGSLSLFTETEKQNIKIDMCKQVVEVGKMKCGNPRLEEGSVIFVYDASALDGTPTVIVTDDLPSLIAAFQQKIERGEVIIIVDGDTYIASDGVVSARLTAEEITTPGPQPTTKKVEKEDGIDEKAAIIIVVVIVALIVVFFIVVAAVCCYRKSKSKKEEMPFTDISGKSNPAYEKTAY